MQAPLSGTINQYQGINVLPSDLPGTAPAFAAALQTALPIWEHGAIKLVWITIPIERADFIPFCAAAGFQFHHSTQQTLTMVKRLVANALLPDYATHTIGVGAVVISAERKILVVLERADISKRPYFYKLPGGMLNPGEHIADGARREVLEETGIMTGFERLVSMRHHHQGQFATSNLYIVCQLKPLSDAIVIDPVEIADAKWVDIDTYLADERVGVYGKHALRAALAPSSWPAHKLDGYMQGPDDYEIYSPTDG